MLSYSSDPLEFEIYPKYEKKTKDLADKLVKNNFTKLGPNKYKYQSLKTDNEFIIKVNCPDSHNKCSCTCKTFVKKGICLHAVGLSNIYKLNLFNPKYTVKEKTPYFISKNKRGPKSKKGYGKALDKPDPLSTPKSSTPNSSPDAHVAKKVRMEILTETSPLQVSKKSKKIKGAEPTRKSTRKLTDKK